MKGTHVLLGITGGIAAYKSAELCRLFVKAGATVQVVMTPAACEFITPLTMETLSGRPVRTQMFGVERQSTMHIDLGDEADLMLVAPATADFLARSATGRASDLLSAVTLAFDGTVIAAPAMNTNMWNNPATQRNLTTLTEEHGWHFVDPGSGELACGWIRAGRMAEPTDIFAYAQNLQLSDLVGQQVVITAGPTAEDLDPVRYLTNRSSGKMGFALAVEAAARGAMVTLITGPASKTPPVHHRIRTIPVRSALQMQAAVNEATVGADAVVMCAAVADFRPATVANSKLKKGAGESTRTIELVRNPDILAELSARYHGHDNAPFLVGFALETKNLEEAVRRKLQDKKVDLMVGNLAADGFGGDSNEAIILDSQGSAESTGRITKRQLARKILDRVAQR